MDKVIIYTILIISLFISTISCSNNSDSATNGEQQTVSELPSWLIGTWQQDEQDDEEPYVEVWKKKGDTLVGGGYFTDILEVDTLNAQVKIYNVAAGMVHEFIGSEELTLFPVKIVDENTFICVNPDQKTFPSSIKYTRLSDKQMILEIAGNIDGFSDSYAFNMYKK